MDLDTSVAAEDATVLGEKLTSLAAFLDISPEKEEQLEDEVFDGLNIYVSNLMTKRIKKVAQVIIENQKMEASITEYVKTDKDVGLLHSFFAVLTNYCSHKRSAISLMKYKGLLESLSPFWFESKYKVLFPFSLSALQNLSTEAEKRDVLLQERPSVLVDTIRIMKEVMDDNANLLPLITFLANMTATREARRLLLKSGEKGVFEDVFQLLDPARPKDVRLMASRFIKHMTADEISHSYLLEDPVNILPVILLPLAGNETFTDEEYSQMPPELQYLESTKARDEDSEIRQNLLFALLQLCRLKKCREKIRDANSYYILRELHKFETEEDMLDLVEKIVDLLIRTEEEIGEKGDFVDFKVPELDQWLSGEFIYPEDSSGSE